MTSVALSKVKLGDRLAQDVITPLGSTLMHKGAVITPREREVLEAFLIQEVVIESREGGLAARPKQEESQSAETKPLTNLEVEYNHMFTLLKRIFSTNTSGIGLPILELRNQLEQLLKNSSEYNVLAFRPTVAEDNDYMFHNSALSALTSYQLAQWCQFPQRDWMPIAMAGLFHDIGNIRIDRTILYKPTELTREEAEEMRRHTLHGYNLLKNVPAINEGVKLTALQHHEKIDGSGYPLAIGGDSIHPYARIVAIADIFHAMTLKRSYRQSSSPYQVLEQLQVESFGKLDPSYVRTFIEKATQFHNGMVVQLSDGRTGEIIFSDRQHPTRPWVSVNGQIVNLTIERNLHIHSIVQPG
ncbi:HD-GYP domain-containing protein [Paenibacillus sambharensis]|uniref:HD-GYP domain-containing protein n=1 Tax=Paenibacillus sambharensis TaxID=1803190 RepID=A0A2W1LDB2_9BACL|nr:HD-GYP domain-containing protein [Paenibacillus sambharensis]PZD96639.1 HD-GYP domain-containing protein [Paenibacillus sambharensis]